MGKVKLNIKVSGVGTSSQQETGTQSSNIAQHIGLDAAFPKKSIDFKVSTENKQADNDSASFNFPGFSGVLSGYDQDVDQEEFNKLSPDIAFNYKGYYIKCIDNKYYLARSSQNEMSETKSVAVNNKLLKDKVDELGLEQSVKNKLLALCDKIIKADARELVFCSQFLSKIIPAIEDKDNFLDRIDLIVCNCRDKYATLEKLFTCSETDIEQKVKSWAKVIAYNKLDLISDYYHPEETEDFRCLSRGGDSWLECAVFKSFFKYGDNVIAAKIEELKGTQYSAVHDLAIRLMPHTKKKFAEIVELLKDCDTDFMLRVFEREKKSDLVRTIELLKDKIKIPQAELKNIKNEELDSIIKYIKSDHSNLVKDEQAAYLDSLAEFACLKSVLGAIDLSNVKIRDIVALIKKSGLSIEYIENRKEMIQEYIGENANDLDVNLVFNLKPGHDFNAGELNTNIERKAYSFLTDLISKLSEISSDADFKDMCIKSAVKTKGKVFVGKNSTLTVDYGSLTIKQDKTQVASQNLFLKEKMGISFFRQFKSIDTLLNLLKISAYENIDNDESLIAYKGDLTIKSKAINSRLGIKDSTAFSNCFKELIYALVDKMNQVRLNNLLIKDADSKTISLISMMPDNIKTVLKKSKHKENFNDFIQRYADVDTKLSVAIGNMIEILATKLKEKYSVNDDKDLKKEIFKRISLVDDKYFVLIQNIFDKILFQDLYKSAVEFGQFVRIVNSRPEYLLLLNMFLNGENITSALKVAKRIRQLEHLENFESVFPLMIKENIIKEIANMYCKNYEDDDKRKILEDCFTNYEKQQDICRFTNYEKQQDICRVKLLIIAKSEDINEALAGISKVTSLIEHAYVQDFYSVSDHKSTFISYLAENCDHISKLLHQDVNSPELKMLLMFAGDQDKLDRLRELQQSHEIAFILLASMEKQEITKYLDEGKEPEVFVSEKLGEKYDKDPNTIFQQGNIATALGKLDKKVPIDDAFAHCRIPAGRMQKIKENHDNAFEYMSEAEEYLQHLDFKIGVTGNLAIMQRNSLLNQYNEIEGMKDKYRETEDSSLVSEYEKSTTNTETIAILRELAYRKTGLFLNHAQIFAILMQSMHGNNSAIGLPTGSGKSLILAISSILQIKEGHTTCIATSNDMLAKEAYDQFRLLYSTLGIKTKLLTSYTDVFKSDKHLLIGSISNIAFLKQRMRLSGKGFRGVLFLDEFDQSVIDSKETFQLAKPAKFLSRASDRKLFFQTFAQNFKDIYDSKEKMIDVEKIKTVLEQLPLKPKDKQAIKDFSDMDCQILVASYLEAKNLEKNVDYLIDKQEIVPIINCQLQRGSNFMYYTQHFLAYNIQLDVPEITNMGLSDTAADLINSFDRKTFISGTIADDVEWNLLDCSTVVLPSIKASNRVDRDVEYVTDDSHKSRVCNQAITWAKDRPVLIFVEDANAAEELYDKLSDHTKLSIDTPVKKLKNGNPSDSDVILVEAGKVGQITIVTPAMSRGFDYKPEGENGLAVIKSYVSPKRIEQQELGRAARQGAIGHTARIYSCTKEELEQLKQKKVSLYELRNSDLAGMVANKAFNDLSSKVAKEYEQRELLNVNNYNLAVEEIEKLKKGSTNDDALEYYNKMLCEVNEYIAPIEKKIADRNSVCKEICNKYRDAIEKELKSAVGNFHKFELVSSDWRQKLVKELNKKFLPGEIEYGDSSMVRDFTEDYTAWLNNTKSKLEIKSIDTPDTFSQFKERSRSFHEELKKGKESWVGRIDEDQEIIQASQNAIEMEDKFKKRFNNETKPLKESKDAASNQPPFSPIEKILAIGKLKQHKLIKTYNEDYHNCNYGLLFDMAAKSENKELLTKLIDMYGLKAIASEEIKKGFFESVDKYEERFLTELRKRSTAIIEKSHIKITENLKNSSIKDRKSLANSLGFRYIIIDDLYEFEDFSNFFEKHGNNKEAFSCLVRELVYGLPANDESSLNDNKPPPKEYFVNHIKVFDKLSEDEINDLKKNFFKAIADNLKTLTGKEHTINTLIFKENGKKDVEVSCENSENNKVLNIEISEDAKENFIIKLNIGNEELEINKDSFETGTVITKDCFTGIMLLYDLKEYKEYSCSVQMARDIYNFCSKNNKLKEITHKLPIVEFLESPKLPIVESPKLPIVEFLESPNTPKLKKKHFLLAISSALAPAGYYLPEFIPTTSDFMQVYGNFFFIALIIPLGIGVRKLFKKSDNSVNKAVIKGGNRLPRSESFSRKGKSICDNTIAISTESQGNLPTSVPENK